MAYLSFLPVATGPLTYYEGEKLEDFIEFFDRIDVASKNAKINLKTLKGVKIDDRIAVLYNDDKNPLSGYNTIGKFAGARPAASVENAFGIFINMYAAGRPERNPEPPPAYKFNPTHGYDVFLGVDYTLFVDESKMEEELQRRFGLGIKDYEEQIVSRPKISIPQYPRDQQ